jgi:hypothetical protein
MLQVVKKQKRKAGSTIIRFIRALSSGLITPKYIEIGFRYLKFNFLVIYRTMVGLEMFGFGNRRYK